MEHNYQKKTKLLVAELRVIALTLTSKHCRDCLNEAADRLEEIEKIAEFYRKEAEKNISIKGDNDKCSNRRARNAKNG